MDAALREQLGMALDIIDLVMAHTYCPDSESEGNYFAFVNSLVLKKSCFPKQILQYPYHRQQAYRHFCDL